MVKPKEKEQESIKEFRWAPMDQSQGPTVRSVAIPRDKTTY